MIRSLLLLLSLLLFCVAACAGTATKALESPARPGAIALQALDTSACLAADVLPGVPALIDHLSSQAAPVAERTILGLIAGIGAVGKGVACYLRSQAAVRTQDGPAPCVPREAAREPAPGETLCAAGEVRKVDEVAMIRARASCTGEGCRREQVLARLLVAAEQRGLVVVR